MLIFNIRCVDIDECSEEPPICDHECSNSIGSFECACVSGYKLRADRYSCKAGGPAPYLIFANPREIRKVCFTVSYHVLLNVTIHKEPCF